MHDLMTSGIIIGLALLSLAGTAAAILRLLGKLTGPGPQRLERLLAGVVAAGATGLFLYRAIVVHQGLVPLQSHLDGLLLIGAIFGGLIAYLQSARRLPGVGAFGLPVLTFLLTWALCASAWTYRPFNLDEQTLPTLWKTVHLAGVYLGTLLVAIAAIAGGMFLYARRKLRRRESGGEVTASLERIERIIVRTSALGFGLLTVGLATGVVIMAEGWSRSHLTPTFAVKVGLSVGVWLIYGLLMNVRHTVRFRGPRAAWLSILGLVLLLAVFGVVSAMSRPRNNIENNSPPAQEIKSPATLPAAYGPRGEVTPCV
ncbi:MAG: cytochrome c biogenesis protein CcsA [Phycisphaeraceae bacterium]|nr:cytochrome c biogenesis protein CcsA [Phycisphaeraceae bacterium]